MKKVDAEDAGSPGAFPRSIQAGIPKLGETPKGWARHPLGNLLRRVERPARLLDERAYQLVTAKRNRGGIVAREMLRGDQIRTKTQFYVEAGDFLISNRQISHGACGIVPPDLHRAVVSNEYSAFHTTEELDPAFLNALSHSVYFQQTCFHSSIGVHVEKLVFRLEDWLSWHFDVPPPEEQRRIVAVLGTWDRAIEQTEKLIAATRRRKTSIVGRALLDTAAKRGFIRDIADVNPRNTRIEPEWFVSFVGMEDVSESGALTRKRDRVRRELGNGYTQFRDIGDLKEKSITAYTTEHLTAHKAHECDAAGKDEGKSWKIRECLVFEIDLGGRKCVLSGDRWYCIDANLAKEVADFFAAVPQHVMPAAHANDNEEAYNKRVATGGHNMLCLDRKTVRPTGANYPIETCDFLAIDGALIHVKDHTSSSRLSHLFNQGTVSARVLKTDGAFRDLLRAEVGNQEAALTLTGYQALIADSSGVFDAMKHRVIYAVLCSGGTARLPFFSLVTFRQAAKELQALGFSCAFAWIKKPASTKTKKARKLRGPGGGAA